MTKKKDEKTFDLEDRLIDFAVRIIRTAESLPNNKVANHIAGQLIRCGTSSAPNYGEAQSAESRADFIHKMKVWQIIFKFKKIEYIPSTFDIRYSIFCGSLFVMFYILKSTIVIVYSNTWHLLIV